MEPPSPIPRRSWSEEKQTSGVSASTVVGSIVDSREKKTHPSNAIWVSRSSFHEARTAGLYVTTRTRLASRFFARWYAARVLPKRIFAFQRKRGAVSDAAACAVK